MSLPLTKRLALFWAISMLVASFSLFADTEQAEIAQRAAGPAAISPANIIRYIHDRFEVPSNVSVEAQPVHRSPFPRFYQTAVTVDDGKQKRASDVFITDDARCFVMGNIFALDGATDAEIERCVRAAAKLPATAQITISHPFESTPFPDLLKSTVTVRDGKRTQNGELYITRDHRTAILGLVLPYRRDFVETLINTRNQPSVGPDKARVTVVEYADLECPMCAAFQKFLESEFLPRYGGKVRIVFKEFPLPSHPWSTTAAVANECAYSLDPPKFLNFRSLIFSDQQNLVVSTVREQLLNLGEQAGLNRLNLSRCLDANDSLGRIDACRKEAQVLGVSRTPTFFVNGRIVVGVPPGPAFDAIVEEALANTDADK